MSNLYTFEDPFTQLHREINKLFSRNPMAHRVFTDHLPTFNVYDDGECFLVKATVPGVSKEDLELTVKDKQLMLRGERRIEEATQGSAYHRRERTGGRFNRVLDLPQEIDVEKVSAKFEDGILEIVLPRAASAAPRKITIG